jgi:serine/threonine protein kinase
MGQNTQPNFDSVLGRIVVEQGLSTLEEVQQCVERQRASVVEEGTNPPSLGDLMVEGGVVTRSQLERIKPLAEEVGRGQQISGYRIIKKLGAGAMATVYMAEQLSLDRIVAIKVLPRKYNNNQQYIERFHAEGKAAAKLNHPNIVQAFDVGKAGEYHYFVMEYVEGRTVGDDLSSLGRYEEKDALQITIQVARALDHAHKAGFIHRDVKPKNIMINSEGVAKLADMGLARAESDREAAEAEKGKAYGTPYYISPEQIRGQLDVDTRADIYGLGATLYHMVTGKVPFDGPNPSAVMHQHLKADLVPPDELNQNLSAGICEVVEACMAKDRDKRFNTSADLLEDVEAVANGESPLQARMKFDIASLAALEDKADPAQQNPATDPRQAAGAPLASHPLFWLAVAGWVVACAAVVVAVIVANS